MTIAVGGVKGAGGVTSSAFVLAAAAALSGPTLLVEADPSGGSMLAWCESLRPGGGDLYDVAMSREPDGWPSMTQQVGDVAVLASYGRPFRLTQALARPRLPWHRLFGMVDGNVFVDVGRLSPGSPTGDVVRSASVLVVVSPPEPGPLATTMSWATRGGQDAAADVGVSPDRLVLITAEVVGRRRHASVTPKDLSAYTDAFYAGHLPHDPEALDLLCRGASATSKPLRRSKLMLAAGQVCQNIAAFAPADTETRV